MREIIENEILPRLKGDRLFLKEQLANYAFEIGLLDETKEAEIIKKLNENHNLTLNKIVNIDETITELTKLLKDKKGN